MRSMHWVHKEFRLNGSSFSDSEELIQCSKSISLPLHTFLKAWFSEDDFVLVKTSGSTGKPKDIQLRKAYMKNSAMATGEFFNIKEKTTALCCLPIDYIAGKMMVVRAMILGWHMDVVEPSSNPLIDVSKSYDFSAMVPIQLRNSLDKMHLIDQLIVGGGVVSSELEEMTQDVTTRIYATYGMTETITHIAVKPLNVTSSLPSRQTGEVERSHYKTLPNVFISIDDRNCLIINAPKVADEEIVTNDVVELISSNEFQWKGRYDNVINSGGVKLHPEEIEKKLSRHIDQRFFTIGIPDEELGEKLVLVVEGEKSFVILNLFQNPNFDDSLTKYEIPKEIFFVKELLETETKKIQRFNTLQLALSQ